MNREILFRGKRVDNGEWVYGLPYEVNEKVQAIRVKEDCGEFMSYMTFAVDPNTVGQYTGLTDKNGNRVYENDILFDEFGESYCIVKFGKYASSSGSERFTANVGFYTAWVGKCQNLLRRDLGYWLKSMNNTTSVVGNIHDNPDMLTGKGEG